MEMKVIEPISPEIKETGCCPIFSPIPWDNVILDWKEKIFVKDKVRSLFYMPINFGSVMKKLNKIITDQNAETSEWLCLSDHTSKWNMDVLLEVSKEISSLKNEKLTGKFFSKVYDGNFKETSLWMKNYNQVAKEKGYNISKYYMWYTTCPKCAKVYQHNFVVIIGKIEN